MSVTIEAINDIKPILLKYQTKYVNGDKDSYNVVMAISKSIEQLMLVREKENAVVGFIPDGIKLPDYITPLMNKWLIQYKLDIIDNITSVGLFDTVNDSKNIYKSNKDTLKDATFKMDVYFNQLSDNVLMVYESSGLPLAGSKTIYKYTMGSDGIFIKNDRAILNMIS